MTDAPKSRPAMVRHNGRVTTLSSMSGAVIAAILSDDKRAELSASLGMSGARASEPRRASRNRLQQVADAVATRPACKGKAAQALAMLSDDSLATVPASGLIKILESSMADDDGASALAEVIAANARTFGNGGAALGNASSANHGWEGIHADIRAARGEA